MITRKKLEVLREKIEREHLYNVTSMREYDALSNVIKTLDGEIENLKKENK
jgi:hypothetical protein